MWKFNKTILFYLIFGMSICTGLSAYMIDWELVYQGKGVFREIHLPLIFLGLTFYFMIPYVRTLKEENQYRN